MSDPKLSLVNVKNNWNWNTGSEAHGSIETSNRPNQGWSTTADVEVYNVGVDVGIEMVKGETGYGNGLGKFTLTGPSIGVDVGAKSSVQDTGVSAMVELSAVKGEATLGPVYVSTGLNANTGVKVGREGVKASLLGFGFTFGVGGKWTLDTPLGSLGACEPIGVMVEQRQKNQVMIINESY